MRVLLSACLIVVLGGVCARGDAEPMRGKNPCPGDAVPAGLPALSYDVATIRAHAVDDGRMSFSGMPHEALITITGISGRDLVRTAFGIQGYQLQGGPDWLSSRRFDLQAKADDAANGALSKLSNCWATRVKNQMLAGYLPIA